MPPQAPGPVFNPDIFAPDAAPPALPAVLAVPPFISPLYTGTAQDGSQLFYSSAPCQTTVAADLGPVLQLNAISGLPQRYPFKLLLEWGTASQEIAIATSAPAGNGPYQFTGVLRACDGGGPQVTHSPGAQVNHGVSAGDFYQVPVVFNVCAAQFGGGADPTGQVYSDLAFAAAYTAAAGLGGGIIDIPPGTYKLQTNALTILANNIIVTGHGNSTVINQVNPSANGITLSSPAATADLIGCQISNLTINGPGSGSGYGIYGNAAGGSYNLRSADISNVQINGFGLNGIHLRSPITSSIQTCRSQNNGLHGFYINNGTSTTFISCWALNNLTGVGWFFQGGTYWAMEGCASDYNAQGYMLAGVAGMSLNGCGCESINSGGGYDGTFFKISGSSGVVLNGCYVYNNTAVGYWVTAGSTNVSLNNCTETEYLTNGTASFKTDSGTMTSFNGLSYQTALALTSGTYNELNDGTTGEMSIAGALYANSVLYIGSGSSTVYTATASTPSLTSATAAQINTTQDVLLYANIKVASTFSLAIGPTATPATTVFASATAAIGLISVRIPASWYVKSTFTSADVTWTAVTC